MKVPKNGFKIKGACFTLNGMWFGRTIRYGKELYLKSYNCRFDDTCGGTEEISPEEFFTKAERYASIFGSIERG